MKHSSFVKIITLILIFSVEIAFAGGSSKALPPLKTVDSVEIERFMGDWHVLANIPTPTEKGCHNALEQYALNDDKTVAVTFSCSKDSFEAEREVHHFKGYIQNPGVNSEWKIKMNFLGFIPIKLPFLVIDLATDYSFTVIGYPSRDYVWIMAREKTLPESTWNEIFDRLKAQDYDLSRIERLPIQ